jgi:hypothetical protein
VFPATAVLGVVLAVAFAAAGMAKVVGATAMREASQHLDIAFPLYRGIGVLELAGATGLLIGLRIAPLGVAAGVGLALLMLAAVATHLRARDSARDLAPAMLLGLIAASYVVTRLVSA